MASMLTTTPSRLRPAASFSSNTGMAVVSLVLSSTASCPRTRRLLVAKAETRCSAARPLARSWLRLTVLPSMAIASRGSGQQARTQSMKQAANRSGSIRFIMMLSQRPEGIPQLNGRNRRKNSRWPFPQSETASKLSHSAIVAQTHTSNTSFSLCATLSGLRLSSIREKCSSRSRNLEGRAGFIRQGVHGAGSESEAPIDSPLPQFVNAVNPSSEPWT